MRAHNLVAADLQESSPPRRGFEQRRVETGFKCGKLD